jgi:uncharacterized protein (DUF427 family)
MAKAMWNGIVLAESDNTRIVEGNRYFPPDSIKMEFLRVQPPYRLSLERYRQLLRRFGGWPSQ